MRNLFISIIVGLILISIAAMFLMDKLGNDIINSAIDSGLSSVEKQIDSSTKNGNGEPGTSEKDNSDNKSAESIEDLNPKAGNGEEKSGMYKENMEARVSPARIKKIKEDVTVKDKMTVAAMVLKKLSASEINEVKGMLSGGISSAEKAKAIKLVYGRFTAKEIAEIKEIYHKYMKK